MEKVKIYTRTWRWLIIIVGVFLIALTLLHPVNQAALRIAGIVGIFLIWLSLLIKCRRKSTPSVILLALPVVLTIYLVVPIRITDHELLRSEYLEALKKLDGSAYIWGGESTIGVDCSGLPRLALRQAHCRRFFSTGNPSHARAWLESWWFDSSAKALSNGYRGFTTPVNVSGTLYTIDHTEILPGDLAITSGGVHLLVYLGDGQWIQADPGPNKVHIKNPRTDSNGWFSDPSTIHRWRGLYE